MKIVRSVLAVLAGLVTLTVVSLALEAAANPLLMHAFPAALPNEAALSQNVPARLLTLLLTMASVAVGGYVTAWIASGAAARHAVIMGGIEVLMTIAAMLVLQDKAPLWSWIAAIVLIVPAAWLGSRVRLHSSVAPRPAT